MKNCSDLFLAVLCVPLTAKRRDGLRFGGPEPEGLGSQSESEHEGLKNVLFIIS